MELTIEHICSTLCQGKNKYHGDCCHIEGKDFILGFIYDKDDFIKRLEKLRGEKINEEDIFFTYEEGSKLFPDKPSWQLPFAYPALKVNLDHPNKPCIFYDNENKCCSIHSIRPGMCRNYNCEYLVKTLNIRGVL